MINLCGAFLVKGKWHCEFIESHLAAIITQQVVLKLSAAFCFDSVILIFESCHATTNSIDVLVKCKNQPDEYIQIIVNALNQRFHDPQIFNATILFNPKQYPYGEHVCILGGGALKQE